MEMRPISTELVRRIQGQVKWFCQSRGYGFVQAFDIDDDILLHQNVLQKFGLSSVAQDAQMDAFVRQTPQGLQVTEVIDISLGDQQQSQDTETSVTYSASEFVPARVKWYDKGKGFGFVNRFGVSTDCFIHECQLNQAGLGSLMSGEALGVVVSEGPDGPAVLAARTWSQLCGTE